MVVFYFELFVSVFVCKEVNSLYKDAADNG